MRVLRRLLRQARGCGSQDAPDPLLLALHRAAPEEEPLTYEERVLVEGAWAEYRDGQARPLEVGRPLRRAEGIIDGSRWKPVAAPRAHDELCRMERGTRQRALVAVRRLLTGRRCNIRRVQGLDPPTWRLRDSSWQIVFRCDRPEREVVVLRARAQRATSITA